MVSTTFFRNELSLFHQLLHQFWILRQTQGCDKFAYHW